MGEAIRPLPFYFFIIILLSFGKLLTGASKAWVGNSSNVPIELSNPDSSGSSSFKNIHEKPASITFNAYNYDEENDLGTVKYEISIDQEFVMCKMYGETTSGFGDYGKMFITFYNFESLTYDIIGIYGDRTYETVQYLYKSIIDDNPSIVHFTYPWGTKLKIILETNKLIVDGLRCIFYNDGTIDRHYEYATLFY